MKEEQAQQLLTNTLFGNKLTTSVDSTEEFINTPFGITKDDTMTAKFYDFQCIILYGYIRYEIAQEIARLSRSGQPTLHLISTPLELYESPYMAKLFAPTSDKRQLMSFAVYVQDHIFDELDLELENHIKAANKPENQIRQKVSVIRNLKRYKPTENSKGKPYISYTIQNTNAIQNMYLA